MKKSFPLTVEDFKLLHFIQGFSISEISRRYNINVSWVSTWAKRNGVQLATVPTPSHNISEEQIITDCKGGLSTREIATKHGISKSLAAQKVRRYNLKSGGIAVTSRKMTQLWTRPEYRNKMSQISTNTNVQRWKLERDRLLQIFRTDEYRKRMAAITTISQTDEVKTKIAEASRRNWQNPEYASKVSRGIQFGPKTLTKPHNKVLEILDSLGVKYVIEYGIGPYNFDVFLPEYNKLIEVQGDYWHQLPEQQRRDKGKSTYISTYHHNLSMLYVWEHECLQPEKVMEKLKYHLGISKVSSIKYKLNSLTFKEVSKDEADKFLYTWHYIHHGRHGLDLGYYLADCLVCVARFTSPHRQEIATAIGYKQNEVLELSRLCVQPQYHAPNLLSNFLSKCVMYVKVNAKIKCLVAFADTSYGHTGAVYKASNWTLHSMVAPNYYYVDGEGWVMHKRTLWDHAKKMSMKEHEFADKYGYRRVWGMEKLKFIKKL